MNTGKKRKRKRKPSYDSAIALFGIVIKESNSAHSRYIYTFMITSGLFTIENKKPY